MKHRYFKFYDVPVLDMYWIPICARYVYDTAIKYPAFLKNKKYQIGHRYEKDTGGHGRDTAGFFFGLK